MAQENKMKALATIILVSEMMVVFHVIYRQRQKYRLSLPYLIGASKWFPKYIPFLRKFYKKQSEKNTFHILYFNKSNDCEDLTWVWLQEGIQPLTKMLLPKAERLTNHIFFNKKIFFLLWFSVNDSWWHDEKVQKGEDRHAQNNLQWSL